MNPLPRLNAVATGATAPRFYHQETAIDFDRYSLIINGNRTLIRSGAMHYFRLPSADLWRDRLYKIKAAGYNTVDLYFPWAYHAPDEMTFDFSGNRDIQTLLKLVEEIGLYLIARPGPYINAEYSGGALPNWLIANPDIILRNRREDGAFQWCDRYMDQVKRWWGELLPRINQCPNLILMQIENEYATLEVEPDYHKALYDLAREQGVTVPLFHNDLYTAGLYEDVVDIYAFDHYSVTSFQDDWRGQAPVFSVIDHVEESLRPYCENRPLFVAELQAGWYASWKGHQYNHIIGLLGREHLRISTKSLIGQGLTLFNHYKLVGGTNWDYIGSTDTYTSYDFAAPISEAGINTERLYEAKALNVLLQSFPFEATDRTDAPEAWTNSPYFYAFRTVHLEEKSEQDSLEALPQWLFLRNLTDNTAAFEVSPGMTATIKPHDVTILPLNMPLCCGMTLVQSTVEPLYQTNGLLVLRGDRPAKVRLKSHLAQKLNPSNPNNAQAASWDSDSETWLIDQPALSNQEESWWSAGPLIVLFLGADLYDRLWLQEGGSVLIGPDSLILDSHHEVQQGFRHLPASVTQLLSNGHHYVEKIYPLPDPLIEGPKLGSWRLSNVSAPLYDNHAFFQVDTAGADFDINGIYDGTVWYRAKLPSDVKTITLDARHIWAAFLDGDLIGHGQHFITQHGETPTEPVTISLPPLSTVATEHRILVVLVDGLGRPKGFHDDCRTPQGLLKLDWDGKDARHHLYYSVGFESPLLDLHTPAAVPVLQATTTFTWAVPEQQDAPLGLELANINIQRLNLYLNGHLIGRYWHACRAQTRFYLPPGFLNTNGQNELAIVAMDVEPLLTEAEFKQQLKSIRLVPYEVQTLIPLESANGSKSL